MKLVAFVLMLPLVLLELLRSFQEALKRCRGQSPKGKLSHPLWFPKPWAKMGRSALITAGMLQYCKSATQIRAARWIEGKLNSSRSM